MSYRIQWVKDVAVLSHILKSTINSVISYTEPLINPTSVDRLSSNFISIHSNKPHHHHTPRHLILIHLSEIPEAGSGMGPASVMMAMTVPPVSSA
jgi:hypothetical protein